MSVLPMNHAVKLTVFLKSNGQNSQIVIPMSQSGVPDPQSECEDVVDAFQTNALPELLDCLSVDTEVTALQAVGYGPGYIPFRGVFPAGTQMGTRAGVAAPNQVASIVTYYPDSGDLNFTRVKTGKDLLPGISISDVTLDVISGALAAAMDAFADKLIHGITGAITGSTWFRVIGLKPGSVTDLLQAAKRQVRDYLATVRRRLLPH